MHQALTRGRTNLVFCVLLCNFLRGVQSFIFFARVKIWVFIRAQFHQIRGSTREIRAQQATSDVLDRSCSAVFIVCKSSNLRVQRKRGKEVKSSISGLCTRFVVAMFELTEPNSICVTLHDLLAHSHTSENPLQHTNVETLFVAEKKLCFLLLFSQIIRTRNTILVSRCHIQEKLSLYNSCS